MSLRITAPTLSAVSLHDVPGRIYRQRDPVSPEIMRYRAAGHDPPDQFGTGILPYPGIARCSVAYEFHCGLGAAEALGSWVRLSRWGLVRCR